MALPYDPASQVTQILHQLTAISTQINQAAYAYNPVGNRTNLTDRRGSPAFGYDTLDRLTSASHPLLAAPQAFAYDAVGNRTTGGTVVNAGNQLTADATYSYQYDDNGNLTRKTLLAIGSFTQYTYDMSALSRIISCWIHLGFGGTKRWRGGIGRADDLIGLACGVSFVINTRSQAIGRDGVSQNTAVKRKRRENETVFEVSRVRRFSESS